MNYSRQFTIPICSAILSLFAIVPMIWIDYTIFGKLFFTNLLYFVIGISCLASIYVRLTLSCPICKNSWKFIGKSPVIKCETCNFEIYQKYTEDEITKKRNEFSSKS